MSTSPMQAVVDPTSVLPAITDPLGPAPANAFDRITDRIVLPYLVDERDVIYTRHMARMLTQLLPLSVAMFFLPTWLAAALGVPYIAYALARFGGRTVLGLHQVTHRPLFTKRYRYLDRIMTYVLPPFIGVTPFAYKPHHVMMHHVEGNSEHDLSGTGEYQRDNIWHFLHYWARFTFFGYWHMTSWLIRRDKTEIAVRLLIGEAVIFALYAALLFVAPVPTFFVLIVPFCMMRFFLMAGNWTEHAFVDVDEPANDWRNSTCLLNTPYNHKCYNAGYHLVHHRVMGLHWADTVPWFRKNLQKFVDNDSIIFDGIQNNQKIWFKLMTGDYDYLARHLVDIGGRRPTHEAKVAFLKHRVQRTCGVRKGLVERREHAPQVATSAA